MVEGYLEPTVVGCIEELGVRGDDHVDVVYDYVNNGCA